MVKARFLLVLAASAALLSACEKADRSSPVDAVQTNTAADEQAIRGTISRWLELIRSKDAAAIARFYADDGVLMPANQPLISGQAAIQQFWQATVDVPQMTMTFQPDRIDFSRSGDLAVDRGTYRFTGRPEGQDVDEKGKYIVVWKKIGNDWKVMADIFNSDAPPGG